MGKTSRAVSRSMGYVETEVIKLDEYRLVAFPNKASKWAYMKKAGLDKTYLLLKETFGDVDEPIISKKR